MAERRKRWRLLAALLLVGVLLALQWLISRPKTPEIAALPPERRQLFAIDFTLPTLQGATLRLSDLRGHVVLLNFWATWCYPCRAEMPSLNALYRAYRHAAFTIVAVASDVEGETAVAPYVHKQALAFPILLDPENRLSARLHLPGIPTSYVLDKHGRIAALEVGARNWNGAHVRRLIEALLAEDAGRVE